MTGPDPSTAADPPRALFLLALALVAILIATALGLRLPATRAIQTHESLAYAGSGEFDPPEKVVGYEIGRFGGQLITLAAANPVALEEKALRALGHDETMRFLLYSRTGSAPELGAAGEPVYYIRARPGYYWKVLGNTPSS